jgi:hypothetical protein
MTGKATAPCTHLTHDSAIVTMVERGRQTYSRRTYPMQDGALETLVRRDRRG